MAEQKNIVERAMGWLRGDDIQERAQRKEAANFPYDATYRANQNSWSAPTPNGYGIYYGGSIDYAVETADLVDNSAVMACMLWIMRTFPEARLRVMKRVKNGKPEEIDNHPLTKLWTRPNPYYSGRLMMQPGSISFNWNGNAYFRKIRNGQKQVIQMYYEPHWTIRPIRASGTEFISYYQLWRNNKWDDVPLEDVIHIRYGLDPENPMLGLSPLASILREVYTDNAAARYASAMMRNLGVPGMIVTPKDGDTDLGDVNRLKAELKQLTTGDNRGDPLLYSTPLDIVFPQIDPEKMNTRENRKITEERISGVLGVPAIVAGLGAGLDRSTFANMGEAREMAYESNIIPTQALWADELNTQLLNELGDPETEFVDWDYSAVRVLQDDENAKAVKWATLFKGGIAKRSEARADLGLDVTPEDDIFMAPAPAPMLSGALGTGEGAQAPTDAQEADKMWTPYKPVKKINGLPHVYVEETGMWTQYEPTFISTNGNGHHEAKAKKPTVESEQDAIMAATRAEIARYYDEVADKVGG